MNTQGKTYVVRQREHAKHVRLTPTLRAKVTAAAARTGRSESEVVREVMAKYAAGLPIAPRQSRSSRLSLWIEPQEYSAFAKRAQREGVTIAAALEAALEEAL